MSDPNEPDPRNSPPPGTWAPPPGSGGEPPSWWSQPATPPVPPAAPAPAGRSPILVALVLIAILSGSALFASGFTLGLQQALAPGTPSGERDLFDPFWEAYRKITTEYVGLVEPKDLVEGAIGGMFEAVDDPYSSYMTSQEYRNSLGGVSGEFEGIGARMTTESPTGDPCVTLGPECSLLVVDVIRESPAEAAGLQPRDALVGVDGEPVAGSTLDDVVDRVKGPRDTTVVLSLVRDGAPLELSIVRDVVRSEDIRAQVLADGTVGYLDIESFSGSAAEDFRTALQQQLDAGITRFVVDVRDDPGGFVDAALSIASEFIADGPVYWEEYADGRQVPTGVSGDGLATGDGISVAVLINGGTASASEILAGALQDTGRATLVGEQSFGKGTIQQWHLLANDSGGFRLSVAKWLTPDKRWIHGAGLTPDVPVTDPSPGTGDDPQLDRAVELLTDADAASRGWPTSAAPMARPSAQPMGWPLRISIVGPLRRFA